MSELDVCFKAFAWYDFAPDSNHTKVINEVSDFLFTNAPTELQHKWAVSKNYFQFLRFYHEDEHEKHEVLTSKDLKPNPKPE